MCVPDGAVESGIAGIMVDVEEMEHWEVLILAPKEEAEGDVGREDRLMLPICCTCCECAPCWPCCIWACAVEAGLGRAMEGRDGEEAAESGCEVTIILGV